VSFVVDKHGLDGQYDTREQRNWLLWEPTEVNGFPAVYADVTDRRSEGDCGITVGITDDTVFRVFRQRSDGPQPCEEAKAVAEQVLDNLKET
jgi:hypothetical protein